VSIWLDDLSRPRLTSGRLAELVAHDHVVGVTTNPTIFAKAIAGSDAYAQQGLERNGLAIFDASWRDLGDQLHTVLQHPKARKESGE
jgi:Transaldolase/Fructose-6-phosphate aldolase